MKIEGSDWDKIEAEHARLAPGKLWPKPRPLPVELPPVAPFPLAVLPEPFRPWVEDIADRMQVPAEYVAVPAMVALGAVIGRKVGIRPQKKTDWTEYPNVWGMIIGRPGVMKSPACDQALKPLAWLQSEARRTYDGEQATFNAGATERDMRNEARKGAMKNRLKQDPAADINDLAEIVAEQPQLRRYIVNDSTYAALGELLVENPNGLLVHRDELISLLLSLDREENVDARSFFLTSWNGNADYTFDRVVRGKNIHLSSLTLSLIGSTQPGRIRDYARAAITGGAADDGMLQRFSLAVWPDVTADWSDRDRELNADARNDVFDTFARLDRMTADDVDAEADRYDPAIRFLRFDGDALAKFRKWRRGHELRLRIGDLHPALESHLAKYRKLAPALALIHHLAGGGVGPVGLLSITSALAWLDYLESHAGRVYAAATRTAAMAARDIGRHLRRRALEDGFTVRDVQRKQWSGLTERDDITDALDMLVAHDWLAAEDVPTSERGGRPTIIFRINPEVMP